MRPQCVKFWLKWLRLMRVLWLRSIRRVERRFLKGQSFQHLDMKLSALTGENGVGCNLGPPQVSYLETLAGFAEVRSIYRDGRRGEVATVALRVEPADLELGNVVLSDLESDSDWDHFVGGVQKGVHAVLKQGVLVGFPFADTKVTLLDFAFYDDSRAEDFEIAARFAMKEACEKAGARLLEPVMALEVAVPGDCISGVLGHLREIGGEIFDLQMAGADTVIGAYVPLSRLSGIGTDLARISAGRARHRMTFQRYELVPSNTVGPDGDPKNFPPAVGMRA